MSPPHATPPWPARGSRPGGRTVGGRRGHGEVRLVVPARPGADWLAAVTRAAATAGTPVAVVVLNEPADAPDLRDAAVATWARVRSGAVKDLVLLVDGLRRAHGLVLVVAQAGPGEAEAPRETAASGRVVLTPARLARSLDASLVVLPDRGDDQPGDQPDRPEIAPGAEPGVRSEVTPGGEQPSRIGRRRVRSVVLLGVAVVGVVLLLAALIRTSDDEGPGSSAVQTAALPRLTSFCPKDGVPQPLVQPDPGTAARVGAAWQRIETVLAAEAPGDFAALRPPATATEIGFLQTRWSVVLQPELVASLLRHDGVFHPSSPLAAGWEPMSVVDIADQRTARCAAAGRRDRWELGGVPFAMRSGDHLLRGEGTPLLTAPGGAAAPAESITALLEGTARALETGQPYAGTRARVDAGRVFWDGV